MKKIVLLLLVGISLLACKENKPSPLFAYLSIENIDWVVDPLTGGTGYRFNALVSSSTSTLHHVTIQSSDLIHLQDSVLLDSVFAYPIKETNIKFLYVAPILADTTRITITMTVHANDGEEVHYEIKPIILPAAEKLRTIDDLTLYSAMSGRPSYFSLKTMTAIMADTTIADLYFRDVAPLDSLDKMSYCWTSPNIYFARFESFDFGEATVKSLCDAYKSCKYDHTIQQIHDDDVILYGTENNALGAIKILLVSDAEGRANDRYIFSIKAILKE